MPSTLAQLVYLYYTEMLLILYIPIDITHIYNNIYVTSIVFPQQNIVKSILRETNDRKFK